MHYLLCRQMLASFFTQKLIFDVDLLEDRDKINLSTVTAQYDRFSSEASGHSGQKALTHVCIWREYGEDKTT